MRDDVWGGGVFRERESEKKRSRMNLAMPALTASGGNNMAACLGWADAGGSHDSWPDGSQQFHICTGAHIMTLHRFPELPVLWS